MVHEEHGRLKVKTTKEQEEERRQKRAQKVKQYRAAYGRIVEKRQAEEKDEEGLQIAQQILEMIPDIHSLWNYRREILEHLKQTVPEDELQRRLESELFLTETCLRANPKSYGAWHHRRWAMDTMPRPDWARELALCAKFLSLDERNFHCWDYRRFVAQRAGVAPEAELAFTDEKINANFSNYSCWHYRSKLLPRVYPDPQRARPLSAERHQEELQKVRNATFTDPADQSAWFYQRWLLGRGQQQQSVTSALLSPALCYAALAHPVREGPRGPGGLRFLVGSELLAGTWRAADGQGSSSVWVFTPASPLPQPLQGGATLSYAVGERGVSVTQVLLVSSDRKSASVVGDFRFSEPPGDALVAAMEEELDQCRRLLDFLPKPESGPASERDSASKREVLCGRKWTLLASALLMLAVDRAAGDRAAHKTEILDALDELVELDELRANYYRDLRSRLVTEYALEQSGQFAVLSGLSLTALYHADLLAPARRVDLSGNALRRPMPQLAALLCCETLILDGNGLSSLSGWGAMLSLTTLSLRDNSLDSVTELAPLARCPFLHSLDLRGNPVASGDPAALRADLLKLLPGLATLNGEPV